MRVLEPRAATALYELALEHDPLSAEAADALADRLVDEQRWPELVRLLRARAQTADVARAVQLRLRLADVFVHQLRDAGNAHLELSAARQLAPDDPAVHEMTATIMASSDPRAAVAAWREVARLAESRDDRRTAGRAYAVLGDLLASANDGAEAEVAWRRAIEVDPLQELALAGLAAATAKRGDHPTAAELYERLRGVGLDQPTAARHELGLARSLVQVGRTDDARMSLRRATLAGGETAAEAHAVLAEIAEATFDREHAVAELDTAISSLVDLTGGDADERLFSRAAELAVARATVFDKTGPADQATADWERAHDLAQTHAPTIARDAARTMLSRAADAIGERRWIDAVLSTRPPPAERAALLVARADVRRREHTPDLAAAVADLHEALALTEDIHDAAETRRRAYSLEAELLSKSGDQRARAQALAALARMADRNTDRVAVEMAAAAAWLAADEPAAALPHSARAHAELVPDVPAALRREVLTTLGEAAWRQRAWPDVIRAYRGLIDDPQAEAARLGTYRYRLAVAADRSGDATLAIETLRPLAVHHSAATTEDQADVARATSPEMRGQALRLFADLAERAGDLAGAAAALEGFAQLATDSSPSARADAMYRAGELFRRAERPDDAVRCLEAALRISDTHLPALDALEAQWRERGDLERVSVILGRKVAATARHPQRQKPLISRLGDLQEQLGRPDVALATHQRALEIDPTWRPSLKFVTTHLRDDGALVAAAGGFAQLAGELPGDTGVDLPIVVRERQLAAVALAELVGTFDDAQLDAVRAAVQPVLDRAALDPNQSEALARGLARLSGVAVPRPAAAEENTPSGRIKDARAGALSLRDGAIRARAAGKLDDAFAALEAANHVAPGDPDLLREIIDLAMELRDHESAARHLDALSHIHTGTRKGETLLELADVCYDRLDDVSRARIAMREAAEAFTGSRRDTTLRLLATEAAAHLAWDLAVEANSAIAVERRSASDLVALATAFVRSGKSADAVSLIDAATTGGQIEDGGAMLAELHAEVARKAQLARTYEWRAQGAPHADAQALRADAAALLSAIGGDDADTERDLLKRMREQAGLTDPDIKIHHRGLTDTGHADPSVRISGTAAENSGALALAAASADRDRLLAAHRESPDDPSLLLALLAHLGDRDPDLRRAVLDRTAMEGKGRAQAIALHELALLARSEARDPIRASALWSKANRSDPTYAPVWMPFADALAGADELDHARELYEQIAQSDEYDAKRRAWAAERAEALGRDDSIISGEIASRPTPPPLPLLPPPPVVHDNIDLAEARVLADQENWPAAITAAERAAAVAPDDHEALELLELLYLEAGDVTSASEAIGRQLVLSDEPTRRAILWRRRAKLYRDALGRDAEAYRCLKEAHACAPADPEIAYQLRTAAMVRGEWALVASLLYREIAVAAHPRDRGALHLELALIFEEKLGDAAQAQVNYEQALAFDPTIPAARAPLAKRYEAIGRSAEAAKLYEEAAMSARAGDRAALLAAAARCRLAERTDTDSTEDAPSSQLAMRLDQADHAGDTDAALALAHQLWRAEPGHVAAFRILARAHRLGGDLPALTELTTLRAACTDVGEERAGAWLEVARLAEELGKLGEAARAYDLALIEDPGHVDALDARGSLAFKLGDWATADLIYRDLGPGESVLGDDELALRRSVIAEQLGRESEALALAQAASVAAPGRRDVLMRVQELATRLGDAPTALVAARAVLELVPLDDDVGLLATHFALVELFRAVGDLDAAIAELERIVRDHPHHGNALEQLADVHIAKGDWPTATRYLYQLVPLAPTSLERADRLHRLGDAVLVHLGDADRADDIFLRASDLDPTHVPTLRRLLDVYWRADDPAALVEVATMLANSGTLATGPVSASSFSHGVVAAALVGDTVLAGKLVAALGDEAPLGIAAALAELVGRTGRFELRSASTAIAELSRRGLLDLSKLRAAASGTAVANVLTPKSRPSQSILTVM